MGYIIEIEENDIEKACEYAEKMLKYGGKLMSCLSEWEESDQMGQRRGRTDYRGHDTGRYGNRYGMRTYGDRDADEWDDDADERRSRHRDGRSRYM